MLSPCSLSFGSQTCSATPHQTDNEAPCHAEDDRCPFEQKVACTFKLAARSLAAQADGRIPLEYTGSPVRALYQQLA